MLKDFYKIALLVFLVFPSIAHAQSCAGPFETITKLERPPEANFSVWQGQYGDKTTLEHLQAGAPAAGGDIVVAGMRGPEGKEAPMLAELDIRGRAVWDHTIKLNHVKAITKMILHKGAYVVLANQGDGVWIGFYNVKGGVIRQKRLTQEGGVLEARDLIESNDGKGFIMAADVYARGDKGPSHAALYKLDGQGNVISVRSYVPGPESHINAVAVTQGGYVAGGAIRGDSGLEAGWVLHLTEDLALDWQQQYPRQGSVNIDHITVSGDHVIVAGQASPSLWVMDVAIADGTPSWDRFYSTDTPLHLVDMTGYGDGRVGLLASNHGDALLINVSPYGALQGVELFTQTEGAVPADLFTNGAKQRVIVGSALQSVPVHDPAKPDAPATMVKDTNGWVMAAPPAKVKKDACASLPISNETP